MAQYTLTQYVGADGVIKPQQTPHSKLSIYACVNN